MFNKRTVLPWLCSVAIVGVWTFAGEAQSQPPSKKPGTGPATKAGPPKGATNPAPVNPNPGGFQPNLPFNPGFQQPYFPNTYPPVNPAPRIGKDYQSQMMKNISDSFQMRMITDALTASAIRPNLSGSTYTFSTVFGSPYGNSFNSPFSSPFSTPFSNPYANPYASPFSTFNSPFANPMMQQMNNPMMMNNPWAMNNPMMMNNPWAMNNPMMMQQPMMMQPGMNSPWQQPFAAPGIFGPNNFNPGFQPGMFGGAGVFGGF